MARFYLIAVCVIASIAIANADTPLDFGMDMSVTSYDAVCWYENLKTFPNTKVKSYNKCSGQAAFQANQIKTSDFFKKYPDKKEEYFGKWLDSNAMGGLPSNYKSACSSYLKDSKASPPADESDTLNDGGQDYPYKGFAYCLMKTLRDGQGNKAIDAVKNERTKSYKHWRQTLLDRENEFRARHGVEPLALASDLMIAAQSWSDVNAKDCKMYHTKGEQRKWHNESTGENLAAGYGDGSDSDKGVQAYIAADGWYEEIKDYPYPEGYQGGDDELFHKIGHFTQSVWKGSKYVGYGLTYNQDCKGKGSYTRYIAARYYPAGNMEGDYPKNVMPIKNK